MRHIEKLKTIYESCGVNCSVDTNGKAIDELYTLAERGLLLPSGSGEGVSYSYVGGSSAGTKSVKVELTIGSAGSCVLDWSSLLSNNSNGLTVSDSSWTIGSVKTTTYTNLSTLSSTQREMIKCITISNVQLSNWVQNTSVTITADDSMVGKTIELEFFA